MSAANEAVVLLATAWGPRHGGINAFNMDLSAALAKLLKPRYRVICIVLGASDAEIADAKESHDVDLLPLGGATAFDPVYADSVWLRFKNAYPDVAVRWWIGHDVTSGGVANRLPVISATGRSAVIHHMSYIHYAGLKHGAAQTAVDRRNHQRMVFEAADERFAVGPLLRDALIDLVGHDRVHMLIPGLPPIKPVDAPNSFKAITFGRLGPEDDLIKQGRLAVAAFAAACRNARDASSPQALCRTPMMFVIGLNQPGGKEEEDLRAHAEQHAGFMPNILPLPFTTDREELFDELRRSSVALMLSRHEGFGLTGWEAIAAEVPLIVSEESGVYQFILEELGSAALIRPVKIDGSGRADGDTFTKADLDRVAKSILECAEHPNDERKKAKALKELLLNRQCTWENTARTLARELGISSEHVTAGMPPALPRGPTGAALLKGQTAEWPAHLEMPDSVLLSPERQIVPFHSFREPQVESLLAWADQPGPAVAIRLVTGEGGMGKTRLLHEACGRLSTRGWHTEFLETDPATDFRSLVVSWPRTVVVIDWAETRRNAIFAILRETLKMPAGNRIRIVLLARNGGDWWERLADTAHSAGAGGDDQVRAILRSPSFTSGPYPVPSLRLEGGERDQVFVEALAALAERKGIAIQSRVVLPDLSANQFGDVLMIHLAALSVLRGEPIGAAHELLAAALGQERLYWKRLAEADGLDATAIEPIEQGIALVTLVGGVRFASEAKKLVAAAPRFDNVSASREQIFDLLRRLYPLFGGLGALQPDLLGEHLIARALSRDEQIIDVVLSNNAPPEWAQSALTVLTRMARHSPADSEHLRSALDRHLSEQAVQALDVAIETGEPMARILSESITRAKLPLQRQVVGQLRTRFPEHSVALLDVALVVARLRLGHVKAKGEPRGEAAERALLEAYHQYAFRLRQASRFDEAIQAGREQLRVAESRSRRGKSHDNMINLASSLGAVASYAISAGHAGEAEMYGRRAEAIYHELASLPATSFRELSTRSQLPMRFKDIREEWAMSLVILGASLSESGQYEEGLAKERQAEEICCALAAQSPDAYRERWGISLTNVGASLCMLGRFEEGLEKHRQAEEIWCALAAQRPDAYRSRWATALGNLGYALGILGQYEEGLAKSRRGEEFHCALAAQRPDGYLGDWADSLVNLASVLCEAGQEVEALSSAERAVEIFFKLLSRTPDAYRLKYGWSVCVLARALVAAKRGVLAVVQAQKAVDALKTCFVGHERSVAQKLANAQEILARAYHSVSKTAYAQEAARRALDTLAPFYRERPRGLSKEMGQVAKTLCGLSNLSAIPEDIAESLFHLGVNLKGTEFGGAK